MKKIIVFCILALIVVFSAKESIEATLAPVKIIKVGENKKIVEQIKKIGIAGDLAPTIEDFEKDFFNKSDLEIRAAIEKNKMVAKQMNFITLANSNQLDDAKTIEFIKYIHLNSALYKILLERQLDEIETENI